MQESEETQVWSLGREDPLRRAWQPTPVFLPGKSHGQRSLADYSPWGCKESDTTEQLGTLIVWYCAKSFGGAIAVLFYFVSDQIVHVLSCPPPGLCLLPLHVQTGQWRGRGHVDGCSWAKHCEQAVASELSIPDFPVSPSGLFQVPLRWFSHFTSPSPGPVPPTARATVMQHSGLPSQRFQSLPGGDRPGLRASSARPDLPRHPLLGRPLASLTPLPVTTLGLFMESQRVGHDWTTRVQPRFTQESKVKSKPRHDILRGNSQDPLRYSRLFIINSNLMQNLKFLIMNKKLQLSSNFSFLN